MKRFILVLAIIFTFGLCFIPFAKCASYNNIDNLNVVNRVSNVYKNNDSVVIAINNENYLYTTKRYTIQCFNKNSTTTPFNISSFSGTISVFLTNSDIATTGTNMSSYSTNSNYAYYYNGTVSYNYICIRSSYGASSINLSDYVFNVTLTTATCYIGSFVPNSYYNVGSYNYGGFFNNWKVYGCLEGTTSKSDYTSDMVRYNSINLSSHLDSFVSTNNRDTYQQYLYIETINNIVGQCPQIYLKYAEIMSITINNTIYTYQEATSLYSWLNTNITLYNDNATLFSFTQGDVVNDVINNITIRVADYTFKSSTYYNSTIGIRGYLTDFYISVLNESDNSYYNNGYLNGYNAGKDNGYNEGYQVGISTNKTGFDNLMFAIADIPVNIISSMLNFNILGINIMSFFMAIITLMLFIFLIRKFKE